MIARAAQLSEPCCDSALQLLSTRGGWRTQLAAGGLMAQEMVKAKERTVISPAQLYAILDREFKKRRPKQCSKCRIPLPYFRKPPDEVSANWHIGTPSECPEGCDAIIAELLA